MNKKRVAVRRFIGGSVKVSHKPPRTNVDPGHAPGQPTPQCEIPCSTSRAIALSSRDSPRRLGPILCGRTNDRSRLRLRASRRAVAPPARTHHFAQVCPPSGRYSIDSTPKEAGRKAPIGGRHALSSGCIARVRVDGNRARARSRSFEHAGRYRRRTRVHGRGGTMAPRLRMAAASAGAVHRNVGLQDLPRSDLSELPRALIRTRSSAAVGL